MTPVLLKPSSMDGRDTARLRVRKEDMSALGNRQEVNMKRVGVVLLVIVLQASAFGQQVPDDPNKDNTIRKQTEYYFDAIERRDVKVLDDLLESI
jgi:hypothetical protein